MAGEWTGAQHVEYGRAASQQGHQQHHHVPVCPGTRVQSEQCDRDFGDDRQHLHERHAPQHRRAARSRSRSTRASTRIAQPSRQRPNNRTASPSDLPVRPARYRLGERTLIPLTLLRHARRTSEPGHVFDRATSQWFLNWQHSGPARSQKTMSRPRRRPERGRNEQPGGRHREARRFLPAGWPHSRQAREGGRTCCTHNGMTCETVEHMERSRLLRTIPSR